MVCWVWVGWMEDGRQAQDRCKVDVCARETCHTNSCFNLSFICKTPCRLLRLIKVSYLLVLWPNVEVSNVSDQWKRDCESLSRRSRCQPAQSKSGPDQEFQSSSSRLEREPQTIRGSQDRNIYRRYSGRSGLAISIIHGTVTRSFKLRSRPRRESRSRDYARLGVRAVRLLAEHP